jgi:hypothetical protein
MSLLGTRKLAQYAAVFEVEWLGIVARGLRIRLQAGLQPFHRYPLQFTTQFPD